MKKMRLSPTGSLSLFLNCPRCFWLQMNKGIKRPRGIFPSLPSGMDRVIKKYFDKFREKGKLPPELDGKVKGKLFPDLGKLESWRNWRATDLRYDNDSLGCYLTGALDDCLIEGGYHIPLDYKTKGSEVSQDPAKYYQNQLDCYCLMLESSGYKIKNEAVLVYYSPENVSESGLVRFKVVPFEIKTDPQSAKDIIKRAMQTLAGLIPESNPDCEYCNLVETRQES